MPRSKHRIKPPKRVRARTYDYSRYINADGLVDASECDAATRINLEVLVAIDLQRNGRLTGQVRATERELDDVRRELIRNARARRGQG